MIEEKLNACKKGLEDFYKYLLQGRIRDAKKSFEFVRKTVNALQEEISEKTDVFEAVNADKTKAFVASWNSFLSIFANMMNAAKQNLEDLSDEEFAKSPETWRGLLEGEFKQPVKDLLDIILAMLSLIHDLENPKKEINLPPFEYTKKYLELKASVPVYAQNSKIIDRIETKIRIYVGQNRLFVKGVTDRILTGAWKGYLHAYLPSPIGDHRIVFSWDGKKGVFAIIGKHQELGIN
jgi:hypothetical protein